jgi:hypothetical protein
MFIDEFPRDQQKLLLDFLNRNKTLIVSDIIKGRGKFAVEWILVILKDQGKISNWTVKPINICMNILGGGEIFITKEGSLKIGNITIQRKGGDNGRETANMLQFKINPCLLIDN